MLKIKEICNKLVKKTQKPEAAVQMSSDYWTIWDKRSPEVCIYSKWSSFSVSHQDVSVRTRSVLLLATSQRAGICRRNWKCVMRACVQLVPGQFFIDYWNGSFSCPVTAATTCVKQWPHIPVYRKNDYCWHVWYQNNRCGNLTFAFSTQDQSKSMFFYITESPSYSNCCV